MKKYPVQPNGVPYNEPLTRVAMGPIGPAAKKGNDNKNVAGIVGAVVGGAALGAGGILLSSAANGPESETNTDAEATTGSHPLVDSHVSVATSVNDSMSFSQAFAAARAEVGAGGAFEWHGQVYGTYYKTEWDAMSAADKAEWNNHFAWSKGYHGSHDTASSSTVTHSDGSTSHPMVDGDVAVAATPNDSMSFSEAFASARAEVGAGGVFEWHGKLYGTYYKNEWDHMDANDRAEWNSNFSWGRGGGHTHSDSGNAMASNTNSYGSSDDVIDLTVDGEDESWLPDDYLDLDEDGEAPASDDVAYTPAHSHASAGHSAAAPSTSAASAPDTEYAETDLGTDVFEYDDDVEILGMDDDYTSIDTGTSDEAYLINVNDSYEEDIPFTDDFDFDSYDDMSDFGTDGSDTMDDFC